MYPSTRGCGFAVLEGRDRLINWGLATLATVAPEEFVIRIDAIVREWRPNVLVVEGLMKSRRAATTRQRIEALMLHAGSLRVRVLTVERSAISTSFQERRNKFEIAQAICESFPELSQHMLPKRQPWESERERMAVFSAVALTMVALR